ncbi:MAG: FecR domain-containing protein, partial [bacterium]
MSPFGVKLESFLGIMLFSVVFLSLSTPLTAQQLPEVETQGDQGVKRLASKEYLKVRNLKGRAIARGNQQGGMQVLSEGDTVTPNQRVLTAEGSTVTLTIPGVSVVQLGENAEMNVQSITRTTATEGMLTKQKVNKNEVDLEVLRGKVRNSLQKLKNTNNDYDVHMIRSVAGVRGTTFQCEVKATRESCAVLDGQI